MILPSNYFPMQQIFSVVQVYPSFILSKNHKLTTPHFLHPPSLPPDHDATMLHCLKTNLFFAISILLWLDVENTESHLRSANKHVA